MKRAVGPLDKRKRVTRCQSCVKRRIKCQGGFPCEYCIRTKKQCLAQLPAPKPRHEFIAMTPIKTPLPMIQLPTQISRSPDSICLDHFALFMKHCEFTKGFGDVSSDLVSLIYTCPPLQQATVAIGALEASRGGCRSTSSGPASPQHLAFKSYNRSIQALREQLQSPDALQSEGVLWCTFLLGLFELMSETSGERWIKHMLYGTCRIFQSKDPGNLEPLSERLFEAFSLLEASRAIIYGESTFLFQDSWMKRKKSPATDSMETVLEFLVRISTWSKR
ncbi:hypothetical protein CDV36_007321 [Fusarium kuroshium]|uniref:Zn(2)-C6 fungal-type domain-containing protein n=1 Tax=Fusarium kuroshium TaxID=2010991 RepID=A0A3M2S644_9HYPO|nr:hypothetical protein CDV36_007321 [Fusarium kuroshium]